MVILNFTMPMNGIINLKTTLAAQFAYFNRTKKDDKRAIKKAYKAARRNANNQNTALWICGLLYLGKCLSISEIISISEYGVSHIEYQMNSPNTLWQSTKKYPDKTFDAVFDGEHYRFLGKDFNHIISQN